MDAKGFELLMAAKILGEGGGMPMDAEGFERLMAAKILGKGGGGKIEELEGVPPLTFTANGQSLLDYLISGNTEQTGTPTPENPIIPNGCGEKTENLAWTGWAEDFVTRAATANAYITQVDGRNCLYAFCTVGFNQYDTKYIFKTDFKESTVYTLIFDYKRPSNLSTSSTIQVRYTDNTVDKLPNYVNDDDWHKHTFVTASRKTVKDICCFYSSGYVYIDIDTFMVVEGSTAPTSYIPYGYKLPLTSAGQGVDIYLGEAQTTRRIKKLVLTGEEEFSKNNTNPSNYLYYGQRNSIIPSSIEKTPLICDELPMISEAPVSQIGISASNPYNVIYLNFGTDIMNAQPSGNTVEGLKEYLAAQYAAGTPVTVWYVLDAPETGIVNEPLMKIGDYADTVSMEQAGVSIPTNKGSTTLDVETTIKPSNVYIKYKS
jgi:hypothetical protein